MQVGSWVAHKSVGVLLGVWIAALGCFGSDEAAPGAVGSAANPAPVEARRGAAAAVDGARLRAAGSDGAKRVSSGRPPDDERCRPAGRARRAAVAAEADVAVQHRTSLVFRVVLFLFGSQSRFRFSLQHVVFVLCRSFVFCCSFGFADLFRWLFHCFHPVVF